jgi:hypothetical protein
MKRSKFLLRFLKLNACVLTESLVSTHFEWPKEPRLNLVWTMPFFHLNMYCMAFKGCAQG